jgi:hypothetical protein
MPNETTAFGAGYAQGAGATAEAIRNRLVHILMSAQPAELEIKVLIAELERDYKLEPTGKPS